MPGAFASVSEQTQRTALDSYCSPTGDVCLAVNRTRGAIKLEIVTPSFSGEYTLCVKGPASKRCRDFELGEADGIYFDRVNWGRKFGDQGEGRYKAAWKRGGSKIGPALHFHPGGKASKAGLSFRGLRR